MRNIKNGTIEPAPYKAPPVEPNDMPTSDDEGHDQARGGQGDRGADSPNR